jgi:hypothetical protein
LIFSLRHDIDEQEDRDQVDEEESVRAHGLRRVAGGPMGKIARPTKRVTDQDVDGTQVLVRVEHQAFEKVGQQPVEVEIHGTPPRSIASAGGKLQEGGAATTLA